MTENVNSISEKIFAKFPQLTAEQKDDILALLEEFEKRYGEDFFTEKLDLVNCMRITGLKYITTRDVLMELTHENIHDILVLHPLLEMQEVVFKKIDLLHEVKNSFPKYPTTDLSKEEEFELVIKVADLNKENLTQLKQELTIGDMLIANPKIFYYFF